ncbi:coiled-coil domain-containing protein 169 isoform X2 [Hemitrygon akajei]|uniref:coiled-coil domain-containing protein 169 isoform X2 n=1 Tax=Hemitrygon akajei TaxID=2704970 RepID=UPI003BF9C29C
MEEERAGYSEGDLEWLSSELEQEKEMRDMLDQSVSELRNTVSQLEKRIDNIEDEGNEWKTRYETQQELNLQLERQIRTLEQKVEFTRGNPANRLSSVRSFEEMSVGALQQMIKQLDKEKKSLLNQLKNYEWRIEQEAKAYHKANDDRRTYLTEIEHTCLSIAAAKKQKAVGSREMNVLTLEAPRWNMRCCSSNMRMASLW